MTAETAGGDRLRLTLPARFTAPLAAAAADEDTTPTEWATRHLAQLLGLPEAEQEEVTYSTEPVVVVRLSYRAADEARSGWVPDMSPEQWWDAASGYWRLGTQTRAMCRVLAAAGPDGVITRIWRIDGWRQAEGRWIAAGGRDITTSTEPGDQDLLQALRDRVLPPQRNPVRIITGAPDLDDR